MSDKGGQRPSGWSPWKMNSISQSASRSSAGEKEEKKPSPAADRFKAQAQIQRARERAIEEGRRQGFEEGHKQGHAEGFTSGLAEGRELAKKELNNAMGQQLAPFGQLIQEATSSLLDHDARVARSITDLALQIGKALACRELSVDSGVVLQHVKSMLHHEPALLANPRLWLNPEDLVLVERHLSDEIKAAGWSLYPDQDIHRGGCRLTSQTGELDATVETRIGQMIDLLGDDPK